MHSRLSIEKSMSVSHARFSPDKSFALLPASRYFKLVLGFRTILTLNRSNLATTDAAEGTTVEWLIISRLLVIN